MKKKNYLLIAILFVSSFAFAGTTIVDSIQSGGLTTGTTVWRSFRIYVPSAYNSSTAVPLIFNFHGTGSNAQQQELMCGFDAIADTAHFIIVYPQALVRSDSHPANSTSWNCLETVADNQGTDLKFTTDLLSYIESHYTINTCRVYATGMSIGGFMTHDVGCFLSSSFAAIASVSGIMLQTHHSACNPSHPTPVMQIHGTADQTVPYTGGIGMSGVDTLINWWVNYDNCSKTVIDSTPLANPCINDGSTVENYIHPSGTNGSIVELDKVIGGVHYWPSTLLPCGSSGTAGDNNDFSASLAIWNFFRPYCLDNLNGTVTCITPSVTAQPTSTTICEGNNTSFGIVAAGTSPTYQWQVNTGSGFTNLSNGTPYSNVTSATLTITGATATLNGYQYQCVVSGCSTSATSNAATLTVNPLDDATFSYDPYNPSCLFEPNPSPSVNTTGGTFTSSSSGLTIDSNTGIIDLTHSNSGQFNITYTTAGACPNTSTIQFMIFSLVNTSTPIETCNGSNYIVEFDISGGDPSSYTVDGVSTNITNVNHFTSNPIASGTSYNFSVSDASNCGTLSVTGTKTCVTNSCTATATISGDAIVCPGTASNATISIALTGTPPWSIIYAIAGANQSPITSIMSSSYTFAATTSGVYTVTSVADNTCTGGNVGGSATITDDTQITTSNPNTPCSGGSYVVDFDILGGDPATYTVDGIAIGGTHYTSSSIASGTSYSFTVSDAYNCSSAILTGTVTCSNCAASATISGDATICSGTSPSSIVTVSLTGTAPWSFAYQLNGGSPTPAMSNTPTYTFSATAGVYTLVGVTDVTQCTGGAVSGSATITVNPAITTSTPIETCNGSSYVVAFDISGGDPASYTVNGATNGSHYTSASIASGTAYSFTVNDQYNCTPANTVSGNKTCTTSTCTATAAISGGGVICSGASAIITISLGGTPPWQFAYTVNGGAPTPAMSTSPTYTFAVTAAGTYVLAGVTDATTCTGTVGGSATVTTNTPITTSNKTETCNGGNTAYVVGFDIAGGDPASYTVDGVATNGTHYTSAPIASGTAYSFNVNDASNCGAPVSVGGNKTCFSGTCNATATISGSGTVCSGSTITISIALTGQAPWSFTIDTGTTVTGAFINVTNQNTSPYTITSSVSGNFTVSNISDAVCAGTSSGNALISNCLVHPIGIEENNSLKEIMIYPNPTNGIFNVSIKDAAFNELKITVVDILGTEVFSETEKNITSGYLKQINLSNVSNGMYYIKLSAGSDVIISKLIIQ